MNNRYCKTAIVVSFKTVIALLLSLTISSICFAQTAPPPSLGEETKGQPAVSETTTAAAESVQDDNEIEETNDEQTSPFGIATITESRRESGQLYRIELEHSAGAKQILEENDSDGSIENTSKDIDDTPNLPKWTLGSW